MLRNIFAGPNGLNWIDQFHAEVEAAERDEREERENDRNVVDRFLFHNELSNVFQALNLFRKIINRSPFNLQNIGYIYSPNQFVSVNHEQINQFDVQILLGENRKHFCIAYYPEFDTVLDEDHNFGIKAYSLLNEYDAFPDANQKAALHKMYGDEVMRRHGENVLLRLVPVECHGRMRCPDDGTICNCSEVFTLAHAILLVQGQDPGTFRFRYSHVNDFHGTYYIRLALLAMYTRNELMPFSEEA